MDALLIIGIPTLTGVLMFLWLEGRAEESCAPDDEYDWLIELPDQQAVRVAPEK